MAAPVWQGTLSFGLVSIPVQVFVARTRHGTSLHQFERGTSDRIRFRRINERTGQEVPRDKIVMGAETDDDTYVTLESEELESIVPGRSREMEISKFVPADHVEPLWYDTTYYLAPGSKAAAKPYKLLRRALEQADRIGVATLVMRDRQHLVTIGPQRGVLTLSTMWWDDEIRDPEETLPALPDEEEEVDGQELELANELIDSMGDEWKPDAYTDDYQERLGELIQAKRSGQRRVLRRAEQTQPKSEENVVELGSALRASLKGRKGGERPRASAPGSQYLGEAPLSELPKKELARMATGLGIPGRSKMNRNDLEKAVANARDQRSSRSAS
ncbi:non-homologous end joining protein Ku [Allosalinactinospora lopnorensis]|uniref:non-homologous end joining protein Ku n=1 Tax=Allosalinactinospora lopnorensis TaxID=1352348 RepID=UPI000623CE56|nr:Ku protein [Allosalinactinospora lopnorensis]